MQASRLRRGPAALLLAAALAGTPLGAASAHPIAPRPTVDLRLAPAHPKVLVSSRIGGYVDLQIVSRSDTPVRPRISIHLPQHWSARIEHRTHGQTCETHPHHYVCTLQRQDVHVMRYVAFLLFHHGRARYGKVVDLAAHVSPTGAVDPNPGNNDATLRGVIKGTADVDTHITRTPEKIGKGDLAHFTVTMTNHGPSPASGLTFFLRVITGTHNGFRQREPHGPADCAAGAEGPVDALMPYACDAPTLDPGHTFTYHVTWRGLVRGAQGHMRIEVIHDGYQPGGHLVPGALRIQSVVTTSDRLSVRR